MRRLQLVDVTDSQAGSLLGELGKPEIAVGREPGEGGLTIVSAAVSRRHAIFFACNQHWFFQDLGSTNGSWVNQRKLEANEQVIVKVGDVLQCADRLLRLNEAPGTPPVLPMRSLLVFSHGQFVEEYPIPEYGRALAVGGQKSDLRLDVDIHELPSLVVERRNDTVCAFTVTRETQAFLNGQELSVLTAINDGDTLEVGPYKIIFSDIVSDSANDADSQGSDGDPGATSRISRFQDWSDDDEKVPIGRRAFGKPSEAEETVHLNPEQLSAKTARYEMHPSARQIVKESPGMIFEALEDRIIIVLGLILLVAVIVAVVWLFLI